MERDRRTHEDIGDTLVITFAALYIGSLAAGIYVAITLVEKYL